MQRAERSAKTARTRRGWLDALAAGLEVLRGMLDDLRAHYQNTDHCFAARFQGSDDERRYL